jgi:nanoRNase/pAp phosphatase (c-di-AMP/oligoRNAs hydrolase)
MNGSRTRYRPIPCMSHHYFVIALTLICWLAASAPKSQAFSRQIISTSITSTSRQHVLLWEAKQQDEAKQASLVIGTVEVEAVEEQRPKIKNFPRFIKRQPIKEHPANVMVPKSGFNVVLTHCTADFDSLASAVGLAKLWSSQKNQRDNQTVDKSEFDSSSDCPTFVVLPRGAHPSVQRFLALHKYLFPIRDLKSLPSDLTGLNRLGLVDAQRRDRIGPAENLIQYAKRITVVDHHVDSDSDLRPDDYILDKVGSVSTLIVERLMEADLEDGLTEAEATLLALGIHADTGSLCFDSTTPRDAKALAWVMEQGASQAAIAEHAKSSLSPDQQGVLTQALINTNSTVVHGVTISTVLLSADGFINGLAAVTQDAMELSSSDVYLLGLVYEAKAGGQSKKKKGKNGSPELLKTRLLEGAPENLAQQQVILQQQRFLTEEAGMFRPEESMESIKEQRLRNRLRFEFDRQDVDGSGFLDKEEITAALFATRTVASEEEVSKLMIAMDIDRNGKIDFEEFVLFAKEVESMQQKKPLKRPCTLIIIGRVKAGVSMKAIKLGKLLEQFGGGGHAKAASATLRLNDESEAEGVMKGLVDELIRTSLREQTTVGDFMTAPCLSVGPDMTLAQVEDFFTRYDVRALPVVDEKNDVIGMVTFNEVAAAKERMWNKEQKRLREEAKQKGNQRQDDASDNNEGSAEQEKQRNVTEGRRKSGPTVKAWMKQHVRTVQVSQTMFEVEAILLETDVGCIPVVLDGTNQLVGMVTRTDLLRQHRYYPSLHYNNKGFSDSIAARKPIIELRKRLKKFDLDD